MTRPFGSRGRLISRSYVTVPSQTNVAPSPRTEAQTGSEAYVGAAYRAFIATADDHRARHRGGAGACAADHEPVFPQAFVHVISRRPSMRGGFDFLRVSPQPGRR